MAGSDNHIIAISANSRVADIIFALCPSIKNQTLFPSTCAIFVSVKQ
jgi:hypothetical protein